MSNPELRAIDQMPEPSAATVNRAVAEIVGDVRDDQSSRVTWDHQQGYFLRRRYTREFRNTTFPWPGASDIVMPTIDQAIEELKPLFVQSTVGSRPVVSLVARTPEAHDRKVKAEAFLDWLIESQMREFADEVALASDHYLQHGFCVFQVAWDYRTRLVREVVDRSKLPLAFQQVVPQISVSSEDADLLQQYLGTTVVSQEELKENKALVGEMLQRHFALDPDDEVDAVALKQLTKWAIKGAKEPIVVRRREVERNRPVVTAVEPEDLVVHSSVCDIQEARRITRKRFYSKARFLQAAKDHRWSQALVDKVLKAHERGSTANPINEISTLRYVRDTVTRDMPQVNRSLDRADQIEVWEIYTYMDVDGDGLEERVVMTVAPGEAATNRGSEHKAQVLAVRELPYDHGMWPFVKIDFERNARSFYASRGLPVRLDDLDVEITAQHRAKLNRMTIANSPTYIYQANSGMRPENLRWIPGQGVPVRDVRQVAPLQFQPLDVSFEREENTLLGWVERYTGSINQTVRDQERLTRPRTAYEIQAVQSLQTQVLGSRILLWHKGMAKVFNMVWDLWHQFGQDEVYVRVVGSQDTEGFKFSRAEAQADFDFVPTPAALENPNQRLPQARALLELLIQIEQLPPEQKGDRYEYRLGEAVRILADSIDPLGANRVVRQRTEEEIAQIQQQRQAQQQQAAAQADAFTGPPKLAAQRAGQARRAASSGELPPIVET